MYRAGSELIAGIDDLPPLTPQAVLECSTIVAQLYGISAAEVMHFDTFDNVCAIKATLKRRIASGAPCDSDCYGMSQEAPLLQLSSPGELLRPDPR